MIDIERVLDTLGIEYRGGGTNNFKIICVNPAHKEMKPSMYIHKETGQLHCFGCDYTGSLFTLLHYKGIHGIDAILYLQKFALGGNSEAEVRAALHRLINSRSLEDAPADPNVVELPPHRPAIKNFYLEKRGITDEEASRWGMGIVTSGRNIGWILIPIVQDGVLRNYFLRNTFGEGKLYGAYPRNDILAGLDCALDLSQSIYLTEGIFDAVAVGRMGVQSVACLSNRVLPNQLERLRVYKKIVVVPDTDARGVDLVESVGSLIHNHSVYVCKLPNNRKDASECSSSELFSSLKIEIPWSNYIIEKKILSKLN